MSLMVLYDRSVSLDAVRAKPLICPRNTVPQRDCRLPAKGAKLAHVQKFSGRAIRLARVPGELTIEADHLADQFRQLAYRNIFAETDIHDVRRVVFFQQ